MRTVYLQFKLPFISSLCAQLDFLIRSWPIRLKIILAFLSCRVLKRTLLYLLIYTIRRTELSRNAQCGLIVFSLYIRHVVTLPPGEANGFPKSDSNEWPWNQLFCQLCFVLSHENNFNSEKQMIVKCYGFTFHRFFWKGRICHRHLSEETFHKWRLGPKVFTQVSLMSEHSSTGKYGSSQNLKQCLCN